MKKSKLGFEDEVFAAWLDDCNDIVLKGWSLQLANSKNYIEVFRVSGNEKMPFAHIDRKNGNIHCPAVMDGEPFEFVRGNIADPETRLSDITPYGVECFFSWLPTHKDYNLHKLNSFSLASQSDIIVNPMKDLYNEQSDNREEDTP